VGRLSLERIEQYIRDLEAIKNYEKVRNERDSLKAEIQKLSERIRDLEHKILSMEKIIEELTRAREELEKEIRDRDEKIEGLMSELNDRERKISELTGEVEKLRSRVKELEELKALSDGRTLKEAEEAFLESMRDRIEAEAEELSRNIIARWEVSEKPRIVLEESLRILNSVIEYLWGAGEEPPRDLVNAGLIEKVRGIIDSEVQRRIDYEFMRRVEEEASKMAGEKLDELVSREWPKWYEKHVAPKIIELESKIRINALTMLRGPWNITCDKCGIKFQVQLTETGLEQLLRTGMTEIECINPNCRDFLGRHKIKIYLRDLIASLIA